MSESAPATQLLADITIGVIGAGAAGLAAALALKHMGFPSVTVFEMSPQAGDSDPAADQLLELTANGSRVLHALGLQPRLQERAVSPGFAYLRTRRSGFLLTQRPLGDFSEARYGAPTYLLRHSELLALLTEACLQRGVDIRYERKVVEVAPQSGTITCADEQAQQFSALIVADGAGGDINRQITSSWTDSDSDTSTLAVYARSRETTELKAVYTWLDDRSYCIQSPNPEHTTDLLLVARADHEAFQIGSASELIDAWLAHSHPQLRGFSGTIASARLLDPATARMAEHWHAGRAALLGDACHQLPRHDSQGINTAFEDAWVLAVMMERWEEAPHQGFSDYQQYRQARMRKLYRESGQAAQTLLLQSGSDQLRRNFKWSVVNRFLPEVSMAQWDWLYGYNCIKGFA